MRPEIPEALAERVDRLYSDAGYTTGSELVRDAVRRRLDALESDTGGERGGFRDFADRTMYRDGGIVYGINPFNDSPVAVDRFVLPGGPHEFVFGKIASGKTVSTRLCIRRELDRRDDLHVAVIDLRGEYESLVSAVDGTTVTLDDLSINPLHVRPPSTGESDRPVADRGFEETMEFFEAYFDDRPRSVDRYRETLETALQEAFSPPDSTDGRPNPGDGTDAVPDARRPSMTDLLDQLSELLRNPERIALSNSRAELEEIVHDGVRLSTGLADLNDDVRYSYIGSETSFDTTDSRLTYFDLGDSRRTSSSEWSVLMQAVLGAILAQARRTDDRVLVVIDGFDRLLGGFDGDRIDRLLRRATYRETAFRFVAQSLGGPHRDRLLSSCTLLHLHPGMHEVFPDLESVFGLSESEADLFRIEGSWESANIDAPLKATDGPGTLLGVKDGGRGGRTWIPLHVTDDGASSTHHAPHR